MAGIDVNCFTCGAPMGPRDHVCATCGVARAPQGGPSPTDAGRPPQTPPRQVAPQLPIAPRDLATRYLCAATYLDSTLAETAARTLVDDQHRAVHPSIGVDLTAVARHAAAAHGMFWARRLAIAITRVLVPAILIYVYTSGPMKNVEFLPFDLELPPLDWVPWLIFGWVGTIFLASFLFHWLALDKAVKAVSTHGASGSHPRTLAPGAEQRLADLGPRNTVVFSGSFGNGNPFTGSGVQVASWTITMDISSARDAGTPGGRGQTGRIEPFNAVDLHEWLAASVPGVTFSGLTAQERLYVSGLEAPLVPGLVPYPDRAPATVLPVEVLRSVLIQPTNYARTYLCFEQSKWGGQTEFTYLVRAQILQGKTLFVEGVALAMFPISARYLTATTIPLDVPGRIGPCIRLTRRTLRHDLFANLFRDRTAKESAAGGQDAPAHQSVLRGVDGSLRDHGALISIRQFVAAAEKESLFAEADEHMYLAVLERRILEQTVEFLRRRGVDTSEFERQASVVHNTFFGSVHNIGEVSGSGHSFGDHNQQTNNA